MNGQDFLVLVNYYSRYWEIDKLYKTGATTTIKKIKNVFSRIRITEIIRSDNGPQYNSRKFKKFAKDLQTAKNLLEKAKEYNKYPCLVMLEARNTPVDNYKSPAELACGIKLRSILPIIPNNQTVKSVDNGESKQKRLGMKSKQKEYYDQHTNEQKMLHTGETV